MSKYTIGVDYGTQSGRAVLVNIENGLEIATAVLSYKDGVIDEFLPNTNIKLEQDFALQNPQDYISVLLETVPKVIKEGGVNPLDIIGIGIDFTACTMMPLDKEGRVLCELPEYRENPHAWVKLWKHHAAQDEADKLNKIALANGYDFLKRYGGKISSEWLIPKIWQILDEAPEIYEKTALFMEATDWVTYKMTGNIVRSSCTAGYKGLWHKEKGFPGKDFFKLLDPRLENLVEDKLYGEIRSIGSSAGNLCLEMAEKLGLSTDTVVTVGNVDAHVAAPACNVVSAGKMLMIMGTSACDILLGNEEKIVPGMCGVVEDGAVPGYFAYEAGQSAVGDIFEWFVNYVPEEYKIMAREGNISIHQLLEEKASKLSPGESGLVSLDWWNGNRSVLVDTNLTGVILGMNLLTKPEEIYRSLIEATAFGKRVIIDTFAESGVEINELYACGGLTYKNNMLMQIYADVTNREIKISASDQTPALGTAIFAALAAGKERGGYDNIEEAASKMGKLREKTFKPIKENVEVYDVLYKEYKTLHDYFGNGTNDVMKRLKKIKESVSKRS